MKEIEFRGKSGNKWVFGNCIQQDKKNNTYWLAMKDAGHYSQNWIEVESETIGQFIGVSDKNGIKIYEGDILKIVNTLDEGSKWYSIVYDFGEIDVDIPFFDRTRIRYIDNIVEIEVAGNIYDNPELLEKVQNEYI